MVVNKFIENVDTWEDVVNILRSECSACGTHSVIVPANSVGNPANISRFDVAAFPQSLPKDSEEVYRDNREDCTIQIRYYDDGDTTPLGGSNFDKPVYHIQLDFHNPSTGIDEILGHLFHDLLGIKLPGFH